MLSQELRDWFSGYDFCVYRRLTERIFRHSGAELHFTTRLLLPRPQRPTRLPHQQLRHAAVCFNGE